MSVCPNKNLPEWKSLVETVGEFEAYRDFMETNGEIRTPDIVKAKVIARNGGSLYQVAAVSSQDNIISREMAEGLLKTLAEKFGPDYGWRIAEPDLNGMWRGKVEEPNAANGFKRTVVINPALVRLDTPLHEFGHIFIDMLKGNVRLYGNLMKELTAENKDETYKNKEFAATFEYVAATYSDLFKEENPGITPEELKAKLEEEAVVELLGQLASNKLDPQTDIYERIQNIWNAIVDIIKGILKDNKVDLLKLDPNISFENLANLLAHPEIKFTTGEWAKAKQEEFIEGLSTKRNAIDSIIATLESTTEQLTLLNFNRLQFVVNNTANDYINRLTKERGRSGEIPSPIISFRRYLKTGFRNDTEQIFKAAYYNSTLSPDQFLNEVKTKYPKWFFSLNGELDQIGLTKVDNYIKHIAGKATNQINTSQLRDGVDKINDKIASSSSKVYEIMTADSSGPFDTMRTDSERIDYIMSEILKNGAPAGFSRLFAKASAVISNPRVDRYAASFDDVGQILSAAKREILNVDRQLELAKKGEIQRLEHLNWDGKIVKSEKKFAYTFKNPVSGREETEEITVGLMMGMGGRVSAQFKSSKWLYGDAYYSKPITQNTRIRPGKTQVSLQQDYSYNIAPDGVIVEDRGDAVVVANKTGFGRYPNVDFDSSAYTLRNIQYHNLVPKSDLLEIKTQEGRGDKIMTQVIDSISEMLANQEFSSISFGAARGDSMIRMPSELRNIFYQRMAERIFGKYYNAVAEEIRPGYPEKFGIDNQDIIHLYNVEVNPNDITYSEREIETAKNIRKKYDKARTRYKERIAIPTSFAPGVNVNRTLYQKVNDKELTVPFMPKQDNTIMDQAILNNAQENKTEAATTNQADAVNLAKELSGRLGIDFQIVTAEEAQSIVETAGIKYNGEPAFFVGGIAYFVGTNLTTKNVLHEFSHPFVRNIAKSNPTLFNRLYNQVIESEEGKAIRDAIMEDNPNLDTESDYFKEEVLVRALTKAGLNKLNNIQNESGFAKAIKNILYAIKQALRNAFGKKVKVSKLDVNTTMDELADMLVAGGELQIDKAMVSEEDFVAFNSERQEYIDDLVKLDDNDMQQSLNQFYDISVGHINKLLTNRNYDELAVILTDPDKRGDLQELKSNLQAYQTTVANMAGKVVADMEYTRKRSTAFVNSLFRLDTVMQKILLHVKDIQQSKESQEALGKAYYYDHLLKHWQEFIDDAEAMLDRNNIERSPLNTMLNNIKGSIRQSKKLINEMYADGARDALYAELLPTQNSLKARYDQIIQNLKDKGAPKSRIDREHTIYYGLTEAELKEYNDLKSYSKQGPLAQSDYNRMRELATKKQDGIQLTPEKMEALLRGDIGDANFYNSYLEGYLYNTDPVVGGLAAYVKNQLNEVMARAQAKQIDFFKDIEKPLEDAGFNPLRIGEIGKKMGFLDKVAKKEKDGTLIERLVWSFLNPFKNYRYDYDVYKYNVEQAKKEYNRTGSDASKQAMVNAIADQQAFMRNYFNQEYVDEFYEREELFEKDDIGKEAMYRRKEWGERLRALTEPANTQSEQLAISDELDLMWREYRQMRSIYNIDGTLKTGMDLEVAKRLEEHYEASKRFYEFKPRKGVFQNALKAYEQELIDSGVEQGSDRFKALRKQWIEKNTVRVPKQSWYEWRNDLYKRREAILSKLPQDDNLALKEAQIQREIFDLMGGFKDDEYQTKVNEMSPGSRARVIELEKELRLIQEEQVNTSGLTKPEFERWLELNQLRLTDQWNDTLAAEYSALWDKKNTYGLTKLESRELANINAQLSGIQERLATDYYVDTMNEWLDSLDTSGLGVSYIDSGSAEWLIADENISKLLGQNPMFDKWFRENHLVRKGKDENGNTIDVWTRSRLWSVTVPIDKVHFETFDITDEQGNVVETITGKPKMKYYARVVKPEYKNDKIVGVTVDNKYNWLPKSREKMEASNLPDDQKFKYINEEYYALQQNDPKTFAAMEKMKEHHLKNQDGVSYKGRLYYDFPRLRKSTLETIQDKNALTIYAERVKDFFRRAKDDAESGFNYDDQENLVRMDMFDNNVTNVPISGLYDIDHQDVSLDLTTTLMQYMLSAERQKQLIEISPLVRAVQSVVNAASEDIANTQDIDNVNKMNFYTRAIRMVKGDDKDNVRKKAVNNFIKREFEGERMTGAGSETPWLNNTASLLFKRASFGFFALNIPSALKNSWGAKFQGLIEASAGKYMTHTSFQRGNAWSYYTMSELSFGGQLYGKAAKSLNQQMVELFDPSQDRFEEKFGEGFSRTIAKDAASFSWLYNFRKWVELQATLQIFGGMMYHQKVTQTMPDGTTKEIYYMDAWETVNDKIQLKEGVDPKWGITYDEEGNMKVGKEFKAFKNKVHQVMNNLQGAYAKFDQPEAQRYLAFRFLSYLRRYFTTMTLNRFGFSGRFSDPKPRFNPGMGEPQMGFYITFMRFAKDTIFNLGKNLPYMTQEEKQASLKMITEVGSLLAINLAMSLLFGWDPDDDDKYEKLRQRSGSLPFPLTSEDPDRPFNGWGYLENHMLYLLMNVRAENEQFIPLPGYGLDDYSAMLDLKSIAFGPTVQTYKDIFEDALDIMQGDESAYYKRQVGPYDWQQEGGAKILAHTARTVGLTGSTIDPVKGIKGFQSVQARAR